jgi:hypothetical protein
LSKATPSDDLCFASNSDSLSIGETPGFAAGLFGENSVLFLEVFDDGLLVLIDPAGDGDEQELKMSCHAGTNYSKVLSAQSFR